METGQAPTKRAKLAQTHPGVLASLDDESGDIPPELYTQVFIVLAVHRYYPDPYSCTSYGIDKGDHWDAFDITLTDNKNKRTFILPSDVFIHNIIQVGSQVRLKKVTRHSKYVGDTQISVVVIFDLDVLPDECVTVTDIMIGLTHVPTCLDGEENVPLASSRVYFMDNWTYNVANMNLAGQIQTVSAGSVDLTVVYSIKDAVARKCDKKPTLLVKVMRKSRLVHYVASHKEDKWPFQLPLLVADCSGWCALVMWNRLAVQFHHQLHEGSLLLLRNFRLKPSMQMRTKSFFPPPDGAAVFSSEIVLESHHPQSEVALVITEDYDFRSLRLPDLELRLMSRRDLISVPDCSIVDVAGLVTFVGRVEREMKKGSDFKPKDSGAYYYRRWLHIRGKACTDPIIVLVYSGYQMSTFHSLQPGQGVICRHLLTNQQLGEITSSRQPRHGWLCTTTNSHIYIIEPDTRETLPGDLKKALNGIPVKHINKYRHFFMKDGIFRYPPISTNPNTLLDIQPIRLEDVTVAHAGRQEVQRLCLVAKLTSLDYKYVESRALLSPRKSSRRKRGHESSECATSLSDHILNLWPRSMQDKQTKPRAALIIDWTEVEPPNPFTTYKPCAFSGCGEANNTITNLSDLLQGTYDAALGLTDVLCKTSLTGEEVELINQAATQLIGRRFVVIVDRYTDENKQTALVLVKAFPRTT